MEDHSAVTMASTMWNLITLSMLSSDGDFTTDNYADFGTLVGSANGAESGNVPASLEELAVAIANATDAKAFSAMDVEIALQWLQTHETEANKKFKEFLARHGHRGLKEFDMRCITWGLDPKQIVKAVQGMLRAGPPKFKPKFSQTNVIDQIKTPLTPFKKFLLNWVMKGCRMAVCQREKAKSMLIRRYDFVRLGCRHLARLMVGKGYFTDPDLLFFFSHNELLQLLETRSPKLLRRAKHRQRLYKVVDNYKFPEMICGRPIPTNLEEKYVPTVGSGIKVKGCPVSQGTIKAPARVITSLTDVHTIEPGEILITHGTDIGWTPYFPLLSGVVTELGGLVSHGAVIARECGLPCIVGIEDATKLFQTGDMVYLNATDGFIVKVVNE